MPPGKMPTGFRAVVHADRCVGAGHCAAHAPDIFAQDEDEGTVLLKQPSPPPERREAVAAAARLCPVSAIELVDR